VTPSIIISASPGDTVCRNVPVSFTATITNSGSGPLYQWTKNSNVVSTTSTYTDSIPVNGDTIRCLLTGNATCMTQDTISSNTIILKVNSLPSATITVTGSLHTCVGDSVKLTAPSGDTYLWSNSDTSRIIYASIAGLYNVTVTNAAGCSAVSRQDTLILIPTVLPTITISTDVGDTVCFNTVVTFTAQSTNGGTNPDYQWIKNNVNIGNSSVYIGNPLLDGDVIKCVVTSNATCATPRKDTSTSIIMTINALPSVSVTGSTHLCGTGDSVLLTAVSGTDSYLWSNGDTTSSAAATAAGDYTVTVTDQNNCSAASVPFTVQSYSALSASITQVGDSLVTIPSEFYQWYYNGNIISGAIGYAIPFSRSGYYQVSTIDSNGCRSTSAIDTLIVAGINNISAIPGMTLYPNPTVGSFSINWTDESPRTVRIIDATGNVIADDKQITSRSKQYDLGTVPVGIYYVQVIQGSSAKTVKLSIVK
jgi:hypothetical protein